MRRAYLLLLLSLSLTLAIFLAGIAATPGLAFDGRSGETVVIEAGEIVPDDLYLAGEEITVRGTIQGDLIAAGSRINVEGTVEGDLWAAGQSVFVSGAVEDDARLAGAVLQLDSEARIADDLLAAGYSLQTAANSLVDGDLVFGGNRLLLNGEVAGDGWAGASGVELTGRIGRDLFAEVGSPGETMGFSPFAFQPNMPPVPAVPGGLTVADNAEIGGDLTYQSRERSEIPAATVAGEVVYQEREIQAEAETEANVFGSLPWFLAQLRSFVALLLVGLLLVWLAPGLTRGTAGALQRRPFRSLGWGLVGILAIGITGLAILAAMIFLAVLLGWATLTSLVWTVIGFGLLAFLALVVLFGFIATFLAEIVVSYVGGRLILGQINADWATSRIWPLVLGLLLLIVLTAIPYLGGLINLVVILLGLGALWLLARDQLTSIFSTTTA